MNRQQEKLKILKDIFGHDSFRDGQDRIIDAVLNGNDVVGIMPTGAGKSVCYQVPALMFSGVTLVISPLISLMHDQVISLVQAGVRAAYINSSLTFRQCEKVIENMRRGVYKLIYVAPERLETESFIDACRSMDISMVAIDEAHCVSHWGQDFRPSYLKIESFIALLPKRPVVGAFTATATENVRNDIIKLLSLHDPVCVTTGFDRPNLFFSVIKPNNKSVKLLSLAAERREQCGIVYCSTRANVEKICDLLNENGFSAARYHAGLEESERTKNQDDFVHDRVNIMVATNAFGMGIDKSNVSFIIHYNMPKNLESYYQEAGRAGRDGSEAECILMYGAKDVRTARFFIENSEPNENLTEEEAKELRLRDEIRLKYMTYYCTTNDCLRSFMLGYFGEKHTGSCGKCSNCLTNYELADITTDTQKILSCIVRTKQRFGAKMICDILRGSEDKRVKSFGFDKLSTYGIMKECSETRLRTIIDSLVLQGYIGRSDGDYPVLQLTEKSAQALRGKEKLTARIPKSVREKAADTRSEPIDTELYNVLKALRKTLADRAGVPAYVIFTDATLRDICLKKPMTRQEFSAVNGVGHVKLEKYGDAFIEVIKQNVN